MHERELDGSVDEVRELLDDFDASSLPTLGTAAPAGLQTEHRFDTARYRGGTLLRHTLQGTAEGEAEAAWRRLEPEHDRLIESLFDRLELELA
jgi:hypothetical protein